MSIPSKFFCKKCGKIDIDKVTKDYQAIGIFGSVSAMRTADDKVCGCGLETYWFRGPETVSERIDYAIMNLDYDLAEDEQDFLNENRLQLIPEKSIIHLLNKKSKHQKAVQKRLQKQLGKTSKQARWKTGIMKSKISVSIDS